MYRTQKEKLLFIQFVVRTMKIEQVEYLRTNFKVSIQQLQDLFETESTTTFKEHILIPGLPVCTVCTKGNFIRTAKQTRSADEGMTLFLVCNFCGHQKQ
jgi:DNA-directed RNA polymerase subunit M/transcription elongation factor TFIIS